jgi:TPR repeat protein
MKFTRSFVPVSTALLSIAFLGARFVLADAPVPDSTSLETELIAANGGDSKATVKVGNRYQHGDGVGHDYLQAVSWYRKASGVGISTGMYNLTLCYGQGVGADIDYVSLYSVVAQKHRSEFCPAEGHSCQNTAIGEQRGFERPLGLGCQNFAQ